jgi:hypothetical protein
MTVKNQSFKDRIAQAVEFPFFPLAFPADYYSVGRVPYKFSLAQRPGHEPVAGLELGYLFGSHLAYWDLEMRCGNLQAAALPSSRSSIAAKIPSMKVHQVGFLWQSLL